MQQALGLTSDRVYRWRLLLDEYGPTIEYIKDIDNNVADAICRLEYDPSKDTTSIGVHQCFCHVATLLSYDYVRKYDDSMMQQSFTGMHANSCIEPTTVDNLTTSFVDMTFANTGEPDDEIYPATVSEIASEQRKDKKLKVRILLVQLLRRCSIKMLQMEPPRAPSQSNPLRRIYRETP